MAVRFKFRSSMNFDSVDIDGRPSISVRDLRSKIIRHKNLNICQDFDLVFSDALTGREYCDENIQIPSGSSIIIKRVPAGSTPLPKVCIDSVENFGLKDTDLAKTIASLPANTEVDNFDDFGVDLCPVPEVTFSDSDVGIDARNGINSETTNSVVPRCSEPPIMRCQKLEASDLSEASPVGPTRTKIEGKALQTKLKSEVEENLKLEKVVTGNPPAMQNIDLPLELKCSLCNSFYKEAVMIPCCQHSFCEKCIHQVLLGKARCPKCLSTKCRVEDLLPNLSLRQAIEHFLESQLLTSVPENALQRYAPDGESGIQMKDVSCAVSIHRREPDLPHSPSVTGKGSNQINAESAYESKIRNNASIGGTGPRIVPFGEGRSFKAVSSSLKSQQIKAVRNGSSHPVDVKSGTQDLAAVTDFQGENQPHNLPMHDEADSSTKKKKGLWINASGVDRSFGANDRHKKGDRTCYMCGSPDHLVRDCPAASNPYPRLQTGDAAFQGALPGYMSSYWNGIPLSHVRPFQHIYGNPGMIPFNATMVPITPVAVPSYIPSIYGGLPVPGGFMRIGSLVPPAGTTAERPLSRLEFSELQDCDKGRNLSNENLRREHSSADKDCFNKRYEPERSHAHKFHVDKVANYSEDSFDRESHREQWHDHSDDDAHSVEERHKKTYHSSIAARGRRPYLLDKSSSEVEDMPNSSSWCSEDRHRHHSKSSKNHKERKGQCCNDSSQSRNQIKIEKDVKRKREGSSAKRHHQKHHSHSESGLEPSFSSELIKQKKERDCYHDSRYSRHNADSMNVELSRDRWQMVSGSDEYCREDCHCQKRKRVH
ncbi:E3 ubiquitin ligase PARAQUAT TOLERANCE 3-like isoform X2 [Malania oleifera]|uniref:E3 ubiquitin ligase PARAQUAT TOLERANCE 3-like isoform X2 n=1 Tax=Malania oleifera TaxID=397392 RepID=UPI0025AEB7B3|nr:E3 ubiquitin ligase PARAQUAT TOLERANCE 3-like isoform X2 [Malania oleifera]